jgi:hypothetical protein
MKKIFNTQKGSAVLWIIIVVIVIVGASFVYMHSRSGSAQSVVANSITTDTDGSIENTTTLAPVIPAVAQTNSETGCAKFITDAEIKNAFGASLTDISQIDKGASRKNVSCEIEFAIENGNTPVGYIYVYAPTNASISNVSYVCKNQQTLSIGDRSCVLKVDSDSATVTFAKGQVWANVNAIKNNIAGATKIAALIASRLP